MPAPAQLLWVLRVWVQPEKVRTRSPFGTGRSAAGGGSVTSSVCKGGRSSACWRPAAYSGSEGRCRGDEFGRSAAQPGVHNRESRRCCSVAVLRVLVARYLKFLTVLALVRLPCGRDHPPQHGDQRGALVR